MVPKIHAKGSSFKGAASYLLHDKKAQTSDRVAWTETRNLSIANPDIAWRIMAATSLDQGRLKEQAGIKNTGRKSDKHVLHFTLSWHPEQTPNKSEMMRAANGAIGALGASSHQAMIIAHNDEKQPHVHVMVNRVSPEDGRHLKSSKEKINLSRWAQAYEKESGKIYCANRVANNILRDEGHYMRGEKDTPRNIFEQQNVVAANDNPHHESVITGQKKFDAAIALQGREQIQRHKDGWGQLEAKHKKQRTSIREAASRKIAHSTAKIIAAYQLKIKMMVNRQQAELKVFQNLEETLFGRAKNVVTSVKLLKRVYGEERGSLISKGFTVIANAGARLEVIRKAQARELVNLRRIKNTEIAAKTNTIKSNKKLELQEASSLFLAEREALQKSHDQDRDKLQSLWQERGKERAAAWEKFAEFSVKRRVPRKDFGVASLSNVPDSYTASVLTQHARLVMGEEPKEVANQKKDRDKS